MFDIHVCLVVEHYRSTSYPPRFRRSVVHHQPHDDIKRKMEIDHIPEEGFEHQSSQVRKAVVLIMYLHNVQLLPP